MKRHDAKQRGAAAQKIFWAWAQIDGPKCKVDLRKASCAIA